VAIENRKSKIQNGKEAVRAESLSKRFGSFWAVRDVTFAVKEGEIFGTLPSR